MKITNDNFAATLPRVLGAIDEADFLSFDLELTGLDRTTFSGVLPLDSVRSRYLRVRDSSRHMQVSVSNKRQVRPLGWCFVRLVHDPPRCVSYALV